MAWEHWQERWQSPGRVALSTLTRNNRPRARLMFALKPTNNLCVRIHAFRVVFRILRILLLYRRRKCCLGTFGLDKKLRRGRKRQRSSGCLPIIFSCLHTPSCRKDSELGISPVIRRISTNVWEKYVLNKKEKKKIIIITNENLQKKKRRGVCSGGVAVRWSEPLANLHLKDYRMPKYKTLIYCAVEVIESLINNKRRQRRE